jgi:hypothetical protein
MQPELAAGRLKVMQRVRRVRSFGANSSSGMLDAFP